MGARHRQGGWSPQSREPGHPGAGDSGRLYGARGGRAQGLAVSQPADILVPDVTRRFARFQRQDQPQCYYSQGLHCA